MGRRAAGGERARVGGERRNVPCGGRALEHDHVLQLGRKSRGHGADGLEQAPVVGVAEPVEVRVRVDWAAMIVAHGVTHHGRGPPLHLVADIVAGSVAHRGQDGDGEQRAPDPHSH